jgi:hypothetical protein
VEGLAVCETSPCRNISSSLHRLPDLDIPATLACTHSTLWPCRHGSLNKAQSSSIVNTVWDWIWLLFLFHSSGLFHPAWGWGQCLHCLHRRLCKQLKWICFAIYLSTLHKILICKKKLSLICLLVLTAFVEPIAVAALRKARNIFAISSSGIVASDPIQSIAVCPSFLWLCYVLQAVLQRTDPTPRQFSQLSVRFMHSALILNDEVPQDLFRMGVIR